MKSCLNVCTEGKGKSKMVEGERSDGESESS